MTYEQRMKYRSVFEATQEFAKNTGIAIGESRGSLRKAKEIAKAMLAQGMAVSLIESLTHLSEPEILALG
jgi:predicted transposase YdaD